MPISRHPLAHSLRTSDTGKIVSAREAVRLIRDGDTLAAATQKVRDAGTHPRNRLINRLKSGRNAITAAQDDLADFTGDSEVADLVDEIRAAADDLLATLDSD